MRATAVAATGRTALGGQRMRPRRSTPPGERWTGREASEAITSKRPEALGAPDEPPAPIPGPVAARMGLPRHERPVMLRLRNTLTRSRRAGRAARARPASGCTRCGPTVYRFAHVGNLRSFLLRRPDPARAPLPRARGPPRQEHHRRRPPARRAGSIAARTGCSSRPASSQDARGDRRLPTRPPSTPTRPLVNILPAHVFPRATEHIPRDGRAWPRRSRTPGHAYATPEGNVYYAVGDVPRLRPAVGQHARRAAGRPPRRGRAGQARPGRLRPVEGGRARAACSSGRRRAGATASPAGTSSARRWRCATSAPRFDIHTGGIDNVFPHHEDEIAQSAPIGGAVPARLWVHGEFLLIDGRKMAKSAGNFQRVTELVERGLDPARLPLPDADLAATGASSSTRTGRWRRRLRPSSRCGRGCEALGPPPADGSVGGAAAAAWPARPAIGPTGVAAGATGHGDGRAT